MNGSVECGKSVYIDTKGNLNCQKHKLTDEVKTKYVAKLPRFKVCRSYGINRTTHR